MAIRKRLLAEWTLSYLDQELPATVPGCVHTDLIHAGRLRDIRIDGTEEEMAWIGNTDFTYRTNVTEISDGRSILKFHGLDTLADIYLNGELVLSTKNMHRSYEVSLDGFTAPLSIEIAFHAPLPEMIRLERERGPLPNPYNRPYNILRKMACSYGWDWGPITLTSGIWKPVELITYTDERIIDVQLIPDFDGDGLLKVFPHTKGVTELILTINNEHFTIVPNALTELRIKGVKPWNPRGYGDQPLYQVTISATEDSWSSHIGFRNITLLNELKGERREFAVAINGQRIWLKGVNWIPDDPFPSRITREQYQAKINNLKDLGVNAIRIWGGGIYESDLFYQVCDEAGMLVWQDFLFACAAYSEDPETRLEVEAEARENVFRLSKYASLFMWCGNNECLEGHQNWGWEDQLQGKPWGAHYYFELFPQILRELDPSRIYIPGSPFAVDGDDVMSELSGTNHIWDVWNRRKYQGYESYSPSLAAEFGYNGPGSWPTLMRSLGTTDLDPHNPDLISHQKAFKGMENIENGLRWEFEAPPTEGRLWYFAAQLVQARAVETGVKHFRTRYESCSGSFVWQFNDMWPVLSWAVLDSDSQRKLAWYSLQKAYLDCVIHLDGEERVLKILNEGEAVRTPLTITLITQSGSTNEVFNETIELATGSVFEYRFFEKILQPCYIFVDCAGQRVTRYSHDVAIPTLAPAQFTTTYSPTENELSVFITAMNLIIDLTALPEFLIKNFTVQGQRQSFLPGDTRSFTIVAETPQEIDLLINTQEKWLYSQNDLAL